MLTNILNLDVLSLIGATGILLFLAYIQLPLARVVRWGQAERCLSERPHDPNETFREFRRKGRVVVECRYAALRRSFFAMKMDYAPDENKVNALLARLEKRLNKARSEKSRVAIQRDIDVLICMNQQLAAGTFEVQNFPSYLEDGFENRWRIPTWLMFTGIVIVSLLFIPNFMFGGSTQGIWFLVISNFIMTTRILRLDRNMLNRNAAKFIQFATLLSTLLLFVIRVL